MQMLSGRKSAQDGRWRLSEAVSSSRLAELLAGQRPRSCRATTCGPEQIARHRPADPLKVCSPAAYNSRAGPRPTAPVSQLGPHLLRLPRERAPLPLVHWSAVHPARHRCAVGNFPRSYVTKFENCCSVR